METKSVKKVAESILCEIEELILKKNKILIAIDGRCAAGKTTLAAHLQKSCGGNVIHIDHFFLRPEQCTEERLSKPGGNVDYERFMSEVLFPLKLGEPFSYRPYDCGKQELVKAIHIIPHTINIVEGSYSCHPELFEHYDFSVFLTVDETEQMRRIKERNGEAGIISFRDKWIPLEERYFSAYPIKERCDLCFHTGEAYLRGE